MCTVFYKLLWNCPIEIIYELYKLKIKDTMDEMIDMLWGMPVDIVESCIFPMDRLGLQDWPKEAPIYSSKGLFIHIPILEDEEFDYLLFHGAFKYGQTIMKENHLRM